MRRFGTALVTTVVLVACSSGGGEISFDSAPPTTARAPRPTGSTGPSSTGDAAPSSVAGPTADIHVQVDASTLGGPISPRILGVSSTLTASELNELGLTLNSWGGNPSTRYNYEHGHAWNHGADYEFRNVNYGATGDAAREFLAGNEDAGVASRLAVPTLGWVAKNDDPNLCSFPNDSGGCSTAGEVGTCADLDEIPDPTRVNTVSTPEQVAAWVQGLIADGHRPEYIAMDNEPELWGATHVDVHPECPTYEEILDKYLTYASAIREVAPDSLLTGPVMCCWYDYWNNAPGPADGSGEDFLPWFLENVREHDEALGRRTLDMVDVHFYPQGDVFNDETDDETNARRLRSTRSLWDPDYDDESWISSEIEFIPRITSIIEENYPDTPLMISEWNFGAEANINGALAIADVLGIYGREGVAAAAYWRNPPMGSPGAFAFKMHGNYDDRGSRFAGLVASAGSDDVGTVSAFAAVDETTGILRVMLINKDPEGDHSVELGLTGFNPATTAKRFTYGADEPAAIVEDTIDPTAAVPLAASSITVLELTPA